MTKHSIKTVSGVYLKTVNQYAVHMRLIKSCKSTIP